MLYDVYQMKTIPSYFFKVCISVYFVKLTWKYVGFVIVKQIMGLTGFSQKLRQSSFHIFLLSSCFFSDCFIINHRLFVCLKSPLISFMLFIFLFFVTGVLMYACGSGNAGKCCGIWFGSDCLTPACNMLSCFCGCCGCNGGNMGCLPFLTNASKELKSKPRRKKNV